MSDNRLHVVNKYNAKRWNKPAFMPEDKELSLGGHMEKKGKSSFEGNRRKKDKMYKVNKWNLALFTPEENLFVGGGPVQGVPAGSTSFYDFDSLGNLTDPYKANPEEQKPVVVVNPAPSSVGQKGSTTDAARQAALTSLSFSGDASRWDSLAKDAGMSTEDYMKSSGNNWFGISKKDNPFSKGNIGSTMKGIGAAAAAAGSKIAVDKENPRGLFDQMDPIHQLAGGKESAVGNGLSDAGVGVFQAGAQSGNGYMMLAGAGLKILGGLTNAFFGIGTDEEKLKTANQSIGANTNFVSNAGSFDAIKGPASRTTTDVYTGGVFTGGKADRKNQELASQMQDTYSWAERSVQNNIYNLAQDQISDALRNYSAFGGPLFFEDDEDKRIKRYGSNRI